MILVYVLTAWHAIAAGDLGRPLHIYPTRAACERGKPYFHVRKGEWLTCAPWHMPRPPARPIA